jgi:hypothetical protein
MQQEIYLTLQPIWHTGEQKAYDPGHIVNLDHLSERVRRNMCLQGVFANLSEILRLKGVGLERAKVLGVLGYTSLQALVDADPNDLVEHSEFTNEQVEAWQKQAGRLLANQQPATAPDGEALQPREE